MNPTIVSITDFRNNIADYINRLIYKNEHIVLKKGNKIVAKLSPITSETEDYTIASLVGLWKDADTKVLEKKMKQLDEKSKKDVTNSIDLFK